MKRPTQDQSWMAVAQAVAMRATCQRRQVGAVLVDAGGYIISTGYNGAPRGLPHCPPDDGCVEHGHCANAVHAELNALLQAGRSGRSTDGCTLYTTASPCRGCMSAAINAGVKRVVFAAPYRTNDSSGAWAMSVADRLGIVMDHLPLESGPSL